jgi:PGF-CTERM protein
VIVGETTRIEVTNAYDEPVSGATVRVNDEAVGETDDRGELSIEIDSAGEATVVASDGQIDSEPITVTGIDPSTTDEDGAPAETPDGTSPETPEEQPEDTPGFGIAVAIIALFFVFMIRRIHDQ